MLFMRFFRLASLLTLLGLSLILLSHRATAQAWLFSTLPALKAGAAPPELPANTRALDGSPVTLTALRGKVVLLHFWTFACGNCEHMLPSYAAFDGKYRARGLRVIGVHTPELAHERDMGRLRTFVAEKRIGWTVVPDAGYLVWDAFGVRAWPTCFVIGRDGKILASFVGDESADDIEQRIVAAL